MVEQGARLSDMRICEAVGDGWACPRPTKTPANRFCGAHFAQRKYGVWKPVRGTVTPEPKPPCIDCGKVSLIRGRCQACYTRHRREQQAANRDWPRCACGNPVEILSNGLCRKCLWLRDEVTDGTQVRVYDGSRTCEVPGCT